MLLSHFNLREQPFGVTPDPSYLFLTKMHREALESLLYGIHSGLGFIALTAEPGMGKTTLLRLVLDRLGRSARTVFVFQAISSPTELFRAVLTDLGDKDPQGTLIDLEMRLNEILLEQNRSGKRVVVVLDEAQNMDESVLEAIRMLSNFETSRHKLLQVILCGQHQLAGRLAEPDLVQLRQRISLFATLKPLTRAETTDYIRHRLQVAGYQSLTPLFTPEAVSLIAHYSDGIPRNINNICFNSLVIGYALGKKSFDAEVIREAIADLGMQGFRLADPIDDLEWQAGSFDEPVNIANWKRASFDPSAEDFDFETVHSTPLRQGPALHQARFAGPLADLGLKDISFSEPIVDEPVGAPTGGTVGTPKSEPETAAKVEPARSQIAEPALPPAADAVAAPVTAPAATSHFEGATVAESLHGPGQSRAQFAETDEEEPQKARFAELSNEPVMREAAFSVPDLRARFHQSEGEEEDSSDRREISPAVRLALVAALVFVTTLAFIGWKMERSGDPDSTLAAQVGSWFHPSLPPGNQSSEQAPAPAQSAAPTLPPQTTTTRTWRKGRSVAQHPPQDESGDPTETTQTNDDRSSAFPDWNDPKLNHDGLGERSRSPRVNIPNGGVQVVGARRGQSVAGICVERFNGCTPSLLNAIVELNPDIKDQDHLEAGQRVVLPVIESPLQ